VNSALFFLAIVPPEPILSEVRILKEEISKKYQSKKALNSPAHITVVPPFHLSEEIKADFVESVKAVVINCQPFYVTLRGLGCFENRRRKNPVIFVNPDNTPELSSFHQLLSYTLTKKFDFVKKETRIFAPHMTIAFKDLTLDNFDKAWQELKYRKFDAKFSVNEIFLLEHKDRKWSIAYSFPFLPTTSFLRS